MQIENEYLRNYFKKWIKLKEERLIILRQAQQEGRACCPNQRIQSVRNGILHCRCRMLKTLMRIVF